MLQANSRNDGFQDINEVKRDKDTLDSGFKDKLNKVVDDFKQARDSKGNRYMAEEEIDKLIQDKLQEGDEQRAKSQNDGELKFKKNGERKFQNDAERKLDVEVVDNDKEIDIDDKRADFIKIDQPNVKNEPLDIADKKEENDSNGLEKEIEERLAETLKDAANKVGEEREELEAKLNHEKGDTNNEKEKQIEEKLEHEEFQNVEKNVETNFNPEAIEELRKRFAKRKAKHDDDHEMPPFVTAVRQANFNAVLHLLYSIQLMMPGETIHVYDLDLEDEQRKMVRL